MRELTTTQLHDSFSESPYGQDLVERTRFNDFKPDFVGTELWGHMLGRDVNNLYHMPHTMDLATRFGTLHDLEPASRNLLRVVAITHDWGEAVIGDIALPAKTDEDERKEEVAHRQIASDLFGQQGAELSRQVWEVLGKRDAEHGDMFRAIEYIGYSTTAMRAGKVATALANGLYRPDMPRANKEQLMGGLLAMNKAVEVHNFPVLNKYIDKYPKIEQQLWEYGI